METNWKRELAEFGELHSQDCCVNFEDSRSCDISTTIVGLLKREIWE